MKFGIILFAFSISLSAFALNPSFIPEKLLKHHTALCPQFGGRNGEFYSQGPYALPKSSDFAQTKTLYILDCELYAYNVHNRVYILDDDGEITDVYVNEVDTEGGLSMTADLMGAIYDDHSKTLHTLQLGRGIGDCGSSAIYSFDPETEKFILMEARMKNNCDGDNESPWPVVY